MKAKINLLSFEPKSMLLFWNLFIKRKYTINFALNQLKNIVSFNYITYLKAWLINLNISYNFVANFNTQRLCKENYLNFHYKTLFFYI